MLAAATINSGDTAWVLLCAALVLFMVPGLAFFYAGLVRGSNALVMLQQNLLPLGLVTVTWVVIGYSIAFSNDLGGGFMGDLTLFGLRNLDSAPDPALHVVVSGVAIPTLAFVAYQMMFAVITPALITGATANRLKPLGWAVLLVLWSIVVYPPIAHWLFNPSGWLAQRGAQDWAGGMVVHTSAGAAALAILLVVGKRPGWPRTETVPHSLPLALVGGGILWFGWFGFNAGDGLQANGVAAQALINTHVAAAAGMCVWLLIERLTEQHSTAIGGITGAVAGLATVTPCAGYVSTFSALAIGALAGLVCHWALGLKTLFHFDDALDVIAVHFVGGALGSLLVGFFGEQAVNSIGHDGLLFGGGLTLLGEQCLALVSVIAFSFSLTWLIAMGIEKTVGLRLAPEDQVDLDRKQQGMDAYHLSPAFVVGGESARVVAAAPSRGDLATDSAAVGHRLVTVILETVDPGRLREALLAAGAVSIVVSEAHASDDDTGSLQFRGQRRDVAFSERLRVEVLVPADRVDAAIAAFNQFSSGHRVGYLLQTVQPLGAAPPPAA
ncbi:ammonium transporter [Rhodococcus kronopolitis]|uniref:Ammonium transporter n=1 Tax=Rhodococcus kronopolitis TaxID=1460226 RepID=A0ABV9FW90_9NOCA